MIILIFKPALIELAIQKSCGIKGMDPGIRRRGVDGKATVAKGRRLVNFV
jgi:hypothetical protein